MSELLAFLAGAAITFVMSAGLIWRPRVLELISERNLERDRRIEAESTDQRLEGITRVLEGSWETPLETIAGTEEATE